MKDAIKGLWRRFWHFCCPAILLCWGAEDYIIGMRDHKVLSAVLGVLFVILGLFMFYYESEKLRKEEKDEQSD